MLKPTILFGVVFPIFFFLCVSGQQLLQILSLHHHDSAPDVLQQVSHSLAVSVDHEKLHEVSTTISMAEKWLRTHVLSLYPSTNITSIVVSDTLLCDENQEKISRLVLAAMENIHHSLVRWGLHKKIKVSVLFTPKCLHHSYHLKPVFEFLKEINSTCTVKTHDLSSFLKFRSKTLNVVLEKTNPTSRKLSFLVRSTEVEYSVPSDAATTPLPPLIGVTTPLPFSLPFAPAPMNSPPPYYGLNLPPCNPYPNPGHRHRSGGAMAAPPVVRGGGAMAAPPVAGERVWCVAKPSVPAEKLQEAMDYACGEGGADCDEISPTGSCYFPDSIVAHASYAFNSYWQKNKKNGGTCGFGGTAMLINSDPSFLHCHFTLA